MARLAVVKRRPIRSSRAMLAQEELRSGTGWLEGCDAVRIRRAAVHLEPFARSSRAYDDKK